jgi:oxygen-independent coproporphyrinogen-3 oxidase
VQPSPSPAPLPPWRWPRAAYVHVPFCAHRCGYCDFAIAVGKEEQIDAYLDALQQELATLQAPEPVDTLFLGGGTPTHLGPSRLSRLLALVRRWLPLRGGGELSIEANPDDLDHDRVQILGEFGVTRISVGVQSFQPHLLRVLDRTHSPADVREAMARVKKQIQQVSLDLIFAVPGQTQADWQADLEHALALEPDHLATYGLTYEKGTPLWKQRQTRRIIPLEEERELQLYARGIDTLEAAGFEHYELSNFARPGKRCRHNQVYWANHAYFGFGLGAARYVQGRRELNTRSLDNYLYKIRAGASATIHREELDAEERARETIALQLRRTEGIRRQEFREQTGLSLAALLGTRGQALVEQGYLEEEGEAVRLSRQGKFVADAVIARLL